MQVRVYKPSKTPTQSGFNKTKKWLLEGMADPHARENDALMGWTSTNDTSPQVKLWFETKEEALAFATKEGYTVELWEPKERVIKPKSYAENFG